LLENEQYQVPKLSVFTSMLTTNGIKYCIGDTKTAKNSKLFIISQ
jgi:hypothetical protein